MKCDLKFNILVRTLFESRTSVSASEVGGRVMDLKQSDKEIKEEMRKFCYIAASVDGYFMYGTKETSISIDTLLEFVKTYFVNVSEINRNVLLKTVVKYLNEYCRFDYYEEDWVEMRIHCKKEPV